MFGIQIDRSAKQSLAGQVAARLSEGILAGKWPLGTKLPSSRTLADELGIARNRVIEAYESLLAEAFVETRGGSGTYVAAIPSCARTPRAKIPINQAQPKTRAPACLYNFTPGLPDLSSFPQTSWLRCLKASAHRESNTLWSYESPMGNRDLREAIARYLLVCKGLECGADQILITGGTSQGLLQLATFFRSFKRGILMENPVVSFAPALFKACGHRVEPVPVDLQGLCTQALPERPKAGLIFVSPSHQFPLGVRMAIQRRLDLLTYARKHHLFLIEDDYDGEFRYLGTATSALQRLHPEGVIHLGSFSKSLAPAVRLGYAVLPWKLVERFQSFASAIHHGPSRHQQASLALFLQKGLLLRHVTRLRRQYKRRMQDFCSLARSIFGPAIVLGGEGAGQHAILQFPGRKFTEAQIASFAQQGLLLERVDDYAIQGSPYPDSLILGFGNLRPEEMTKGLRLLQKLLR